MRCWDVEIWRYCRLKFGKNFEMNVTAMLLHLTVENSIKLQVFAPTSQLNLQTYSDYSILPISSIILKPNTLLVNRSRCNQFTCTVHSHVTNRIVLLDHYFYCTSVIKTYLQVSSHFRTFYQLFNWSRHSETSNRAFAIFRFSSILDFYWYKKTKINNKCVNPNIQAGT